MWGVAAWLLFSASLVPPTPPGSFESLVTFKTNLLWNPSPSSDVTNYLCVVSNWNSPKPFTNSTPSTKWPGIMTNREPVFVSITAQASSGKSGAAVTNFFVPVAYYYSVIAQTGSVAGFSDWKSLGQITNQGELLFRLRMSVVASNAITGTNR